MNAFRKNLLSGTVAALFAGAMAVGCSSGGSTGDGGSGSTGGHGSSSTGGGTTGGSTGATTSGTSGGTGGSTGSSCVASGSHCGTAGSSCCSGLVCLAGSCQACGNAADPCCANNVCSSGLVCDQSGGPNNGQCTLAAQDGGSVTLSGAGGPCATLIDCQAPLVCNTLSDGGTACAPLGAVPSVACLTTGSTCPSTTNPGEACCGGPCVNGLCTARTACNVAGQGCATNNDCCNDFQCVTTTVSIDGGADGGADAGTTTVSACQPTCQGQLGACAGNSDCCAAQGLVCLQTGLAADAGPAGVCDFLSSASPPPPPCVSKPFDPNECQLGSLCKVDATTNVDPCAAAGLVCDFFNNVCRNPIEGEVCTVGGAACANAIPPAPFGGTTPSTVNDIECLQMPGQSGATYCLQPCNTSDPFQGTSDCLDRNTTCKAVTGGGICVPNQALGGCGGQTKGLEACTSEVAGDSLCMPITFTSINQTVGFCLQGTLDGGAPGSTCLESTNRQQGGFCNPDSFCILGICEPNCNAGTADAGPQLYCASGESCLATVGESTDPVDQGNCTASCDFTAPNGGGCATDGGTPQKCIPETFYTGTDSPNGLCTSAPASLTATGQVCSSQPNYFDACAYGSLCIGPTFGPDTCTQLCIVGGQSGTPCPTGQTCHALGISSTTSSQYVGYCQ